MSNVSTADFRMAVLQGRIEPYFQPIADLRTGEFQALEARARWTVEGEVFSARHAVERAKAGGYTTDLDFTILEHAIAEMQTLGQRGVAPLCLAVNFSTETILDPDFPERLDEVVRESKMRPGSLRLEFPIDAFCADAETLRSRVKRAAVQGFSVAVDHVHEAAQIENLLEGLPVRLVKLDEALIKQVPDDADACMAALAAAATADRWNIAVGVEGVVRLEQLEWLKASRFAEGQGLLICRPSALTGLLFLLQRGGYW